MSRIVLVLLVVVGVFSASSHEQQCRPNEHYVTCGGCEPTCAVPAVQACTDDCKIGCQCKSGFLRNEVGLCVTRQKCY